MWSHHRGMEVRRSVWKYIYIMMVCLPFLCVLIESCAKIVYSSYCSFCKFQKGVGGFILVLAGLFQSFMFNVQGLVESNSSFKYFFSFQGFFAGPNQRSSITYAVPKTKKGCAANIHRPGPLKPTLLHWRHMYILCAFIPRLQPNTLTIFVEDNISRSIIPLVKKAITATEQLLC